MISDRNRTSVIRILARQPDREFSSSLQVRSGRREVQNLQIGWAFIYVY